MNKIYRVLWSKTAQAFVAVAEIAKSAGKGTLRSSLCASRQGPLVSAQNTLWAAMALAGWSCAAAVAQSLSPTQLPVGGQVTAGVAKIEQSNAVMAITQSSARAAINWQSFHVGGQAKVNITQPSSSSVLLNRILGNSASQIFGQINANGQVIMSNPAGMYFSPTATVDVASFTATTHGISDTDFMAGNMKFTRQGATGKIINEGRISAALGGYVALLAPEVRNSGVVVAKLGTVALASGEAFELEFDKQSTLTNILVTPSSMAALVENGQAVEAPGGLIILSAQAANQLQNGVVKNSGLLKATGLTDQGGVIRLSASHRAVNTGTILADAAPNSRGDGGTITMLANLSQADSAVEVGGTLSAKAGEVGGNGGFIETSASKVTVHTGTRVITLSPTGKTGTWLVDPTDFSIDSGAAAQTSSSIGVDTLQNNLANTSVSISTNNTVGSNSGDLNVNASVNWSAGTTLSLSAYRNVNVNAAITATGVNSGVNLTAKVGDSSGAIVLGANVSTASQQTYNGPVKLNASNVTVSSSGGGVSILGSVAPVSGTSNFTVASDSTSNITGIISGSTRLIKDGNGTLALPAGNTYTGGTVLAGGKIRLDHASGTATNASNALGPSGLISFTGGALQFTANNTVDYSSRFDSTSTQAYAFDTNGQTVTLASLPAGTGTLTKSGNGTLQIVNATTRFANATVGSTVINGGTLALAVANPNVIASQAVISGAGTLSIEPSAAGFSSNITTSTHLLFSTGGGSLGGFNLGKTGNTANMTLDSMANINVTGSQGYFGNNVTLASGAASSFTSWGNGGTLTLSGQDSVSILAPIAVTNANSSIAIKTSQNSSAGNNVGYYNFGLGASGFSGRIDFSGAAGQTFTTQDGTNSANLKTYTFISNLASLRSASASANLALLGDIDAQTFLQQGVPYASIRDGSFTGSFAGLGHTISNLSVRSNGASNAGLFSQIGGGGVVQDVRFERANITGINMNSLGTVAGYANGANVSGILVANGSVNITNSGSWAGGVIGYSEGGALRDAWVNSNPVTAISSGAGGIMGRTLMTVANAHNVGSDVQSNGEQVGGLLGQRWNGPALSRSDASGNVSGSSYVGGLIGHNLGGLSDAFATGNVQGRGSFVGGLLGRTQGGTALTNVSASGTVQNLGTASTGGIVGFAQDWVSLSNATYSGTAVSSAGSNEAVGGLVGFGNDSVTIANASVSNAGSRINISASGAAGGLVGWARVGVTITDSFVSNANISGGTYVGGLVGEQRRSTVQINRSYAGGSGKTNVIGGSFVGGLVGEMIGGYITNSYYEGNITATSNYGGIVGFLKPGAYLSNTFYNLNTSLINGAPTLTIGGLYNAQFTDWVNSNPGTVSARSLSIGNYFDLDNADGYYTIGTSNAVGVRNDLSNVMGFSQGLANGSANTYKFKLTSSVDVASATTQFVPYFAAAEFKGNTFEVNNFSWSAPTSNVGFLGFVHRSTVNGLKVYSTPYETASNVTLAVNGQFYVGTAIGSQYGGVIYDSFSVLGGTTKGLDNTGGFIGYFSDGAMGNVSATRAGTVTDVAKAQVIGSMTYSVDGDQWQDLRGNTGGLAGYLGSASVNGLNSNLEVAGGGYRTGGLLGYLSVANYSHASVVANAANNLSASGNVTSNNQQTGGLIGRASGSANTSSNWTASGNVTGTDILGGLVGNLTSGTFSNLTSTMATVTSTSTGSTAGGLAGYAAGVTLSNASAVTNISATGNYTGGLIGNLDGTNTLTNVSASGNVSTSSYYVGGLVGGLNGNSLIRNARYVGGSVTGNSYVGGLIGLGNNAASEVYGAYTTTNVTATGDYVGGLMGYFEGKVGDSSNASASAFGSSNNHSYAAGNVTGRYDVGGLVGRLGSTAQVTNTYAGVNITANANFGGLVGHFSPGVEVTNSHYNMAGITINAYTPASPAARVVLNDSNGLLTLGGLYGPQYTTWFNAGGLDGLASASANNASVYFGAADANGYYRISTPQHVKDYLGFADQSTLKFRLDTNLDMATTPGLFVPYVAGELKGDGKTVSNLLLSQNTSNLGFVGHLRNNSTQAAAGLSLSNVTVSGSVTGVMNAGLVVGSDWQRNLTSVSSSGSVTGTDLYYSDKLAPSMDDRGENNTGWSNVGGVLGYGWGRDTGSANNLLFNNVSSSANVTGVNVVGGMAGNLHYATVSTTTTTGTVTSVEKTNIPVYRTGGLVGQLIKTNSLLYASNHAQGLVKGVAYVGGLVGEMEGNLGESVVNATATYSTFVSSNVEGKSDRIGGLIGQHGWGSMTNAQMSGTVTGWTTAGVPGYAGSYVGGLGGYVNGNMNYLRYTGVLVKGGQITGGLSGQSDSTISYSSSTGNVSGNGAYVGGISGYSVDVINVTSSATVTGGTYTGGVGGQTRGSIANSSWTGATVYGGHQSGGLVGNIWGTIDNSFATGDVIATSSYIGGLVGNTGNWVRNSYATGNVSGLDTVGGLAGYADWVSNSYARGNVAGTTNVGGFVGNLHQASNSYATGNVSGAGTSIGGFVGYARNDITNSWSTGNVTASNSSYVGGFAGFVAGGTISNATSSGYVYGSDAVTLNYVGGFAGFNQATINNASVNITVVNPTNLMGVSGTQRVGGFVGDNTGNIANSTANAAVSGRDNYVGGFVGLMESGIISNTGDWGKVTGPYSVGGFAGYQNGGIIQASFANAVTSAGGSSLAASTSKVGGFIGSLENGTITSSRAAGAVSGLGIVGGFVGFINNSAALNTSYATGSVTQTSTSNAGTAGGVGGFAGYLNTNFTGTISDVYAMGAVTGTQNVGGLIGFADRGTFTNGYATGMTTFNTATPPATPNIGGVVGGFNATLGRVTATNLYWNTDTSNLSASGGLGTGLTTAQFKSTLANTAGFNAANTNWNTSAGMFPYLQVFYPTQPRAIEGVAYLSDGTVAKRAQVGHYTNGTLLNGGTASTGVNGYFYSIVGSNTVFSDAAIPEGIESVTVDPNNRGSGYNSTPTVSFVGGAGTGALATASRINPVGNATTTSVYAINVTNSGSGYTSAPRVVLSSSDNNPAAPTLNVTLKVPQFNTTQLATVLMLDGNATVNSTVAGMTYSDRILLNDTSAYLYKDSNTNVVERVVQGITRLSTQNSSATLMNQDLSATLGASKQSSVAASLPTISSLELYSRSSAFNLDTPLTYADNGVSNAGNITVSGNSNVTLSGGTYVSSKAQSYNAVLALGANTTFNATTVTSNSTLSGGGFNLTIANVAAANSGNLVTHGDFTGLNNFWVTRNSTLNGHVTSTGNQTYNGLVTLGLDALLTGSNVTLASGASLAGAGHSLDVVGNAIFNGDVSNVTTTTVSGTTRMAANVSSTGNQSYVGAMTLSGDSRLLASGANAVITTQGSIDGASSGAQTLTMNATGSGARVVLNGAVGGGTAMGGLNINAGTITMNAGSVRTSGNQAYTGAMVLTRDTTLSGTGPGAVISMADTINGDGVSGRSLTVSNAAGSVNLNGAVGNVSPLSTVDVTAGTVALNGASVTTSGSQTYAGALTLGLDTTLTGSNVTLASGASLAAAGHSLDVVGNAIFNGDVSNVTSANVSGTTRLAANVSSTGNQSYVGAMTLSGDSRLLASGANAVITTQGSIDGASSGAQTLTMNATGSGARVVLNGAVGGGTAMGGLNINAGTITMNAGSVRTSGNQAYTGAMVLTRDTTLSGTGPGTVISMADTINGDGVSGRSLTVSNAAGSLNLNGAVGNVSPLSTVDVTAGTVALNGGSVNTSGNQTYAGALTLGLDTTLTGSNVTLASGASLTGAGHSLDVVGNAILNGDVSNVTTATVSGTTRLAANVSSTGNQSYAGAMTLSGDGRLLASGVNAVITTQSSIDGAPSGVQTLTMNATGSGARVVLNGAVGGGTAVGGLNINAGTITMNAGSVRTSGNQAYTGAMVLTRDTTLSGTGPGTVISMADTINGDGVSGRSLTVSNAAGSLNLNGAVGNVSPLSTVDVTAGTVALTGGSVNTSGNQTYAGALTLGVDTTLTGSNVTLASGASLAGAGHSLDVMGNAIFNGDVSNVTTANVSGTTRLTANVSSTGNQSYLGAMTLSGDGRLQASGANAVIMANGTIDGLLNGAQSLTVNATGNGGQVMFNAAVGSGAKLSNLSVSTGAITMKAGSVQTTGNQSYSAAMVLGGPLTLSTTNASSAIVLGGTVDSDSTPRVLTLAAGGGNTTVNFKSSVGATRPLSSLVDAAATTQLGDLTTHAPIIIKTQNDLQLKNAVELQAPVQFQLASLGSVDGVMSGAFNWIKDGAGTLTLSNANLYSGNTTVNAGTLAMSHAQALGSTSSPVAIANGAVLELQGLTVVGKELKLQGGTLSASMGNNAWTGRVQVDADSRLDIAGTQLAVSGVVDSGTSATGLLLSGSGAVSLSQARNALSRLASAPTLSSIEVSNSSPLRIGAVNFGATSYDRLQSTGSITLSSTDALTVPVGASISSTGGHVVVEASRFVNQAGAAAVSVPAGKRWQIWSTNASPFDPITGDSANTLNNDYVQYNVTRAAAPTVPDGNGLLFSYAPVATARLTGTVSKVYDATTVAQLTPANYGVTGAVNQDVLTLSTPQTGAYVSTGSATSLQGAGVQKDVLVTNVGLTAQQAGKPVYGYGFVSTVRGTVGVIEPKPLSLTFTKVYEGSNSFDARNGYVLTGMVGLEASPQITAGTVTVASPNAGAYNSLTNSSLVLSDPNYTFTGGGFQATIQPAPLGIAVNLQSKGKTDLVDVASKDFTVVGLQNNEVIPKIDMITLLYKDVSRNDENYVKSITVSPGPGVANMNNYVITQAVNRAVGSTAMNMVKLTSADEVILIPAVPRPYIPDVSRADNAPMPVAALQASVTPGLTNTVSPASFSATASNATPSSAAPSSAAASNTSSASGQSAVAAPASSAASVAASAPVATATTPGIVVSTVNAPSAQTNGLVTVVVPKDSGGATVSGLVIGLPSSVIAVAPLASGETPELKITLANSQPLPDWIRFDANQKALVTTPDARATFPISVTITVGDQRTVVVITESTQN